MRIAMFVVAAFFASSQAHSSEKLSAICSTTDKQTSFTVELTSAKPLLTLENEIYAQRGAGNGQSSALSKLKFLMINGESSAGDTISLSGKVEMTTLGAVFNLKSNATRALKLEIGTSPLYIQQGYYGEVRANNIGDAQLPTPINTYFVCVFQNY